MKILFITLSNIGDVILSLPALDRLIAVYPKAEVTVLCGEPAAEIFEDNFYVKRCVALKRGVSFWDRLKLLRELKKNEYDLIVDLKNSALPLLLKAKYKTYPWFNAPRQTLHMSQRHVYKVRKFTLPLEIEAQSNKEALLRNGLSFRKALYVSDKDRQAAQDLLYDANISTDDGFLLISPGARSHIKRWAVSKFAELGDKLARELEQKIILTGDASDFEVCGSVKKKMASCAINLCGKTSLKCLAALLEKAKVVISNDSAVMHLASYFCRPLVAIFGPTDYKKYGPWSNSRFEVVRSHADCSPCETAQCKIGSLKCMDDIGVDDVYAAVKKLLLNAQNS